MPPAEDSARRSRSVWVLAAAIAVLVVAIGVALAPSDEQPIASSAPAPSPVPTLAAPDGVDGPAPNDPAPSSTTDSTVAPVTSTTSAQFEAPPSQPPAPSPTPSPTAPTTTAASSTTAAPTTTTTTTTPPAPPQASPPYSSVAGEHDDLRAVVAASRAKWEAQTDLAQGYVFRTERLCFCPLADNEISVGPGGEVIGQRNHKGDMEPRPPSVDDLFALLEASINADADAIWVSFDQQRGFPVDLFVDPDHGIADDERGRSIKWLVAAAS